MSTFRTVTARELEQVVAADTDVQFWNALSPAYFTGEMIPGSRHVPVESVVREATQLALPKHATIAVYCSGPSCPNSRTAAEKLASLGYTGVLLFEGGLEEWKASGRATEQVVAA